MISQCKGVSRRNGHLRHVCPGGTSRLSKFWCKVTTGLTSSRSLQVSESNCGETEKGWGRAKKITIKDGSPRDECRCWKYECMQFLMMHRGWLGVLSKHRPTLLNISGVALVCASRAYWRLSMVMVPTVVACWSIVVVIVVVELVRTLVWSVRRIFKLEQARAEPLKFFRRIHPHVNIGNAIGNSIGVGESTLRVNEASMSR